MPFGAFGIRRLLDASQRFAQAGLPVYLRIKNFADNPVVSDLGFQFVPSITGAQVGTQDLQIKPQPEITLINFHSLAMEVQAGVQLRGGARSVLISHTWVLARQRLLNYTTPQQVFTDPSVVGLITDNKLLEITEYIHPDDAFGEIISWRLLCNTTELSSS